MLVGLSIQNIGSVKETVSLNFTRGNYSFKNHPIAFFGSNGSGKTSLLLAIHSVGRLMTDHSSNLRGFVPHLPNTTDEPSQMTLEFIIGDVHFVYEIATSPSEIYSEHLTINGGEVLLHREGSTYQIFNNGQSVRNGWVEGKCYSALRLIGIEEYAKDVFFYKIKTAFTFLSSIVYIDAHDNVYGSIVKQCSIEDLLVEHTHKVKEIMSDYKDFPVYTLKRINTCHPHLMFSFDGETYLPEELLSSGMRTLSILLSTLLSMRAGSLLIVDQLERHLHPKISRRFIETLNQRFNIQLLFTSHNTNLLQVLRPDQIFFTKWDKEKKTSTYHKLSDIYPNIREVNNLEKMYYGGLFD